MGCRYWRCGGKKLEKLGLRCSGGGNHPNGGMSYHVYDKNNTKYVLSSDEFNNIEKWFRNLRKDKINKINGNKTSNSVEKGS